MDEVFILFSYILIYYSNEEKLENYGGYGLNLTKATLELVP